MSCTDQTSCNSCINFEDYCYWSDDESACVTNFLGLQTLYGYSRNCVNWGLVAGILIGGTILGCILICCLCKYCCCNIKQNVNVINSMYILSILYIYICSFI